jgi:hypothetical protein
MYFKTYVAISCTIILDSDGTKGILPDHYIVGSFMHLFLYFRCWIAELVLFTFVIVKITYIIRCIFIQRITIFVLIVSLPVHFLLNSFSALIPSLSALPNREREREGPSPLSCGPRLIHHLFPSRHRHRRRGTVSSSSTTLSPSMQAIVIRATTLFLSPRCKIWIYVVCVISHPISARLLLRQVQVRPPFSIGRLEKATTTTSSFGQIRSK